MIEVRVESIRVSLINQQRLVVLREEEGLRYLPIWIGPFEAEAITTGLKGSEIPRPLTHDLLRMVVESLGGHLAHIVVSELSDETYYALVVVDRGDERLEIDARPSDAIALAVRADVPIFVSEEVMDAVGQLPSSESEEERPSLPDEGKGEGDADRLEVFREFIEGLDLGDLGEPDAED